MGYTLHMKFEWDELKSEAYLLERGFDFAFASHAFFDPNRFIREDKRYSYGEIRYQLMGRIDGRLFVVIYTWRHDVIASFLHASQTIERRRNMKIVRMTIDPEDHTFPARGRIDTERVDTMTEQDIARQKAADEVAAAQDAARFARRVRMRLGFSQAEFAKRINVSLDTIRNWEQGKRHPTGAAKALLKVLDKAPETALAALH